MHFHMPAEQKRSMWQILLCIFTDIFFHVLSVRLNFGLIMHFCTSTEQKRIMWQFFFMHFYKKKFTSLSNIEFWHVNAFSHAHCSKSVSCDNDMITRSVILTAFYRDFVCAFFDVLSTTFWCAYQKKKCLHVKRFVLHPPVNGSLYLTKLCGNPSTMMQFWKFSSFIYYIHLYVYHYYIHSRPFFNLFNNLHISLHFCMYNIHMTRKL